jgi:hypothetical protein
MMERVNSSLYSGALRPMATTVTTPTEAQAAEAPATVDGEKEIVLVELPFNDFEHGKIVQQALAHEGFTPANVEMVDVNKPYMEFLEKQRKAKENEKGTESSKEETSAVPKKISLQHYFALNSINTIDSMKDTLKRVDPQNTSAVNISVGVSEADLFQKLLTNLPQLKNVLDDESLRSITDEQGRVDVDKMEQQVDRYVDTDPQLKEHLRRYTVEVQKLRAAGVPIVVASGNINQAMMEAETLPNHKPTFEDDEALNLFATKETVVVGAADTKGKTAFYSGQGYEVDFTTVPNSKEEGTSFSAPYVTGALVDLMDSGMSQSEAINHLKKHGELVDDAGEGNHVFLSDNVIDSTHTQTPPQPKGV